MSEINVVNTFVGPNPTTITCPSCRVVVQTRIRHNANVKTHIFALILCAICCWPLFWIPYCIRSCKDANHYCSNCGAYIGRFPF